jgi:hypothetical protein
LQITYGSKIEANLGHIVLVLGLFKTRVSGCTISLCLERSAALCSYLLYRGVPLKRKFIVVVEVRELLLGNLDSARAGDVVYTTFLKQIVQHVALVVKSSRTNFTTIIKQVHTEQFALAILVVPSLDV